jgi:Asp-tRNA(Asn)/Glu-tRNA(Gln) amidotransferase A subunit family amidase
MESVNFIYGRTNNPWNINKTTGGSSGGDGGLIAASCCPLAIGSDIGGSVRIPAAFCGVCSIKPSQERVTRAGMGNRP